VVICLERDAGLHMAQPADVTATHSKIQIGCTFLVSAHPGSPGQRAVKPVCTARYLAAFTRNIYTVAESRSISP